MNENPVTPAGEPQSSTTFGAKPVAFQQHAPGERSSIGMALVGGFLASIVGALIWGGITYLTNYQIGIVAIGVGFIVGYAVRYFGNGSTMAFGVIGAVFSLFGCILGNILTVVAAASLTEGAPILGILLAFLTSPMLIFQILQETFSGMDLLFYGIAIYEGFRFSLADNGMAVAEDGHDAPVTLGLNDPTPTQPSHTPPPPPPPTTSEEGPAAEEKKPDPIHGGL